MEFVALYVTAGSREEALRIARALVEERLAACANVLDGVRSLYWWEGKVQDEPEALFVAKTRAELAQRAVERVRELHSYEVPCVVALPVAAGNPAFLDWIAAETGPQPPKEP
ncbi:Divalent-cation tolerance protein CutA [Fundidesulfovibrio magnetotacticus]|uniref:Divalent-cation tolerance protein CutA n=1 Tax=Fundidesulfovibrio magnetotacticus TaxID=2730080 RepID=A0A6V8LQD1_9BACT|nr:Divalent-cation tolerance protein CutA [Fundidesulfovibrio magnetotacticus]